MRSITRTTVALGCLNLVLVAVFFATWKTGEYRIRESEHIAPHSIAPPDLAFLNSSAPDAIDVAGIRDNALFSNRRTFYERAPPSELLAAPDYQLNGTMDVAQGRKVAFLRKKSDQTAKTIHVGDEIEGWRVSMIASSRVELTHDDQKASLVSGDSTVGGLQRLNPPPPLAVASEGLTGVLVLGGQGAHAATATPIAARTYRPPPTH